MSGIYIKNHTHILTDNETDTQMSTDTDYTYLPVTDTNNDYEESNLMRNPLFHSNNDIITGAILTEDQVHTHTLSKRKSGVSQYSTAYTVYIYSTVQYIMVQYIV